MAPQKMFPKYIRENKMESWRMLPKFVFKKKRGRKENEWKHEWEVWNAFRTGNVRETGCKAGDNTKANTR